MPRSPSPSDAVPRVIRLRAGDAEQVLRAAALFDSPLDRRAVRKYLADSRNVFLLAREGQRPIGFLRGTSLAQVESSRPQFFLYEVAVDARHRRRGVGASLIERLLAICRRSGHAEAFVFTDDPLNRAAHALYRSTGAVTETRGDRMYVYRLAGRRAGGAKRSSRRSR